METLRPPHPLITLNEAEQAPSGLLYQVMGVCVDHLPPTKSSGTDETVKFTLWDPSWYSGLGMVFRFFDPVRERLPAIENTGDVLLLRNVTTRTFGSSPFGISGRITAWFVLSGSSILNSTCPNGSDIRFVRNFYKWDRSAPTVAEFQYAKAIARLADPDSYRPPIKATALQIESIMTENGGIPPPRNDKWRRLRDLQLDGSNPMRFRDGRPAFADLFGEVRRIYTGDYRRVELFLTDYTSNSKFYNYEPQGNTRDGDQYGYLNDKKTWPGPWGKMTIEVLLWDVHAAFARSEVKEKSLVLLKNCHIKFDPDGAKLEAVCRGDRNNPSKVNVVVYQPFEAAKDERYTELIRLKREYEAAAVEKGLLAAPPPGKNARKRQRDEGAKDASGKTSKPKNRKNNTKAKPESRKEDPIPPGVSGGTTNQHIRINAVEIPITPIQKLLDSSILKRLTQNQNEFFLPFQNSAYKCKVRVVDYYPEDIAHFAVRSTTFSHRGLSGDLDGNEDSSGCHDWSEQEVNRWEWRFMLIVEDASAASHAEPNTRVPLLVAGKNGDFLFREEAHDLQSRPEALLRLREKLFILWGDLQETKEEGLNKGLAPQSVGSSVPFECLVEEYGIPTTAPGDLVTSSGGYKRLFQMFGTTII